MNGTLTRVFAVYPVAIPGVLALMASMFPGYVGFDSAAQRVTLTFTLPEMLAGLAGGYAVVGGVFAKWGIKR